MILLFERGFVFLLLRTCFMLVVPFLLRKSRAWRFAIFYLMFRFHFPAETLSKSTFCLFLFGDGVNGRIPMIIAFLVDLVQKGVPSSNTQKTPNDSMNPLLSGETGGAPDDDDGGGGSVFSGEGTTTHRHQEHRRR